MARSSAQLSFSFLFFFNDTATTEIYTLSLHDALPISVFSNAGGDVSAPGAGIASTASSAGDSCWRYVTATTRADTRVVASGSPYCLLDGTSLAAPFVTGLAGYLLAYKPDLTPRQVHDTIVTWARTDTVRGAPRIDAFASLLSLPGAAQA